jgi:hypothetical protein
MTPLSTVIDKDKSIFVKGNEGIIRLAE